MRTALIGLLLLSLAIPASAADMFIYAKVPNRPDLALEEYRAGLLQKGDIASCWPHGSQGTEFHPSEDRSILLRVNDMTVAECNADKESWVKNIDYTVVNHFPAQDAYRFDVSTVLPGVSGYGNLTRANVEEFIEVDWNGIYRSSTTNSVRFDVGVYEGATSPAFWDGISATVSFTELSYDETSGIHRIEADYTAAPFVGKTDMVSGVVESKGATVISNDGNVVVYEIGRAAVWEVFKANVKDRVQRVLWARRYYMDPLQVDDVINNHDRYREISRAAYDTNVGDRTLDP